MTENTTKIKTNTIDVIKHIAIATVFFVLVIYGVFKLYFPIVTNHGESLTVPNLEGVMLEDLEEFLEARDLRYSVEPDSGYSAKYPALAVLKQFPMANSKVKENRKIYITLNAKNPPVVKMPDLKDRSLKNAQLELRSLGLELGEIRYKPDFALNTILEQYHEGAIIKGGEMIPKGSKVDFEVRDGLGSQTFQMLNLKNLDFDEAVFVLRGYGLKLGEVYYKEKGSYQSTKKNDIGDLVTTTIAVDPGKVFKQYPNATDRVKIGQGVDLWLVEVDSSTINMTPSLEVEEN